MPSLLRAHLDAFQSDQRACDIFRNLVLEAPLSVVLWPERDPSFFGETFLLRYRKKAMPFPLIQLSDRIVYIENKLLHMLQSSRLEMHPIFIWQHLHIFQQSLGVSHLVSKRNIKFSITSHTRAKGFKTPKNKATSTIMANKSQKAKTQSSLKKQIVWISPLEDEKISVYKRLQKLKTMLKFSSSLSKVLSSQPPSHPKIENAFNTLLKKYQALREQYEVQSLEIELLQGTLNEREEPQLVTDLRRKKSRALR